MNVKNDMFRDLIFKSPIYQLNAENKYEVLDAINTLKQEAIFTRDTLKHERDVITRFELDADLKQYDRKIDELNRVILGLHKDTAIILGIEVNDTMEFMMDKKAVNKFTETIPDFCRSLRTISINNMFFKAQLNSAVKKDKAELNLLPTSPLFGSLLDPKPIENNLFSADLLGLWFNRVWETATIQDVEAKDQGKKEKTE